MGLTKSALLGGVAALALISASGVSGNQYTASQASLNKKTDNCKADPGWCEGHLFNPEGFPPDYHWGCSASQAGLQPCKNIQGCDGFQQYLTPTELEACTVVSQMPSRASLNQDMENCKADLWWCEGRQLDPQGRPPDYTQGLSACQDDLQRCEKKQVLFRPYKDLNWMTHSSHNPNDSETKSGPSGAVTTVLKV